MSGFYVGGMLRCQYTKNNFNPRRKKMNTRNLFVSVLMLVCVLLAACAPAATQAPTDVPPTTIPTTVASTTTSAFSGDPIPQKYLNVEYNLVGGDVPIVMRFYAPDDPICLELKIQGNCFTQLNSAHDPKVDPGARGPAALINGLLAQQFLLCPGCGPVDGTATEYFEPREDGGILVGVKCETKTGDICNFDVGTTWKPAPQQTTSLVIIEYKIPTIGAHAGGIKVGSDAAIWFVETTAQQIGRISTDGVVTEFSLEEGGIAEAQGFIAVGPDGALWFNMDDANQLGRITPTGEITQFDLPEGLSPIRELVTGPDGALWVTSRGMNAIIKLTPDGTIAALYALTKDESNPTGMIVGPDKALWFVEGGANQIGRITIDGQLTEYPISEENSFALRLTAGPDNAVWFTMFGVNKIGRIDMDGNITTFDAPDMGPVGITTGADGALWFTGFESAEIGRMTTDGVLTKFAVPTSASVPYHIIAGPDGNIWFTEQEGNMIGQIMLSAK
jgi:virginiamycin B lyase